MFLFVQRVSEILCDFVDMQQVERIAVTVIGRNTQSVTNFLSYVMVIFTLCLYQPQVNVVSLIIYEIKEGAGQEVRMRHWNRMSH
jgi:hypothetical protein